MDLACLLRPSWFSKRYQRFAPFSTLVRPADYERRDPLVLEEFMKIHDEIEDRSTHERLRDDLVEHLWAIHSSS